MLKALVISYKKNSKIVFDVSLTDYDAMKLNKKFRSLVDKHGFNFDQKVYSIAGNNMNIKPFKRLIDFKVSTIEGLDYMVSEIEKEIK